MEYQVLARKWRPKTFDQVIGQDHVVRTLKNSVNANRIAHAYLLAGTRGVGKTTVARIFAKTLRCTNLENGNPCLKCSCCLSVESGSDIDYIEIDGASNNGVENIRELIENVHFLPTQGKYKIYVIDEVHMLSTGAFNALLKTLEEPPEHVVFIFATTDPQKLLPTVLSRCQRLDFKYVEMGDLILHIQNISTKEGILFKSENLISELCKHGRGSVRDTLSLLDQVLSMAVDKTITEDLFYSALGLAEKDVLKDIISNLLLGNTNDVVNSYKKVVARNIELKSFLNQILGTLHTCLAGIENPQELYQKNIINDGVLAEIEYAEMFWIYEVIAKDSDWVLKSIDPVNILEVLLRKITMRRNLIEHRASSQKKNIEPVIEPEPKDWPGFIRYAYERAPATAANLERGNTIEDIDLASEVIDVRLAFEGNGGQVFMDYLMEIETQKKVNELLKGYYETTQDFKLRFKSLNETEKKETNFVSQAEINTNKEEEIIEDRKVLIRDNPRIVQASKLFESSVDKIVLNNK